MSSHHTPDVALCPRCFCPLDISRAYRVNFCNPVATLHPPATHHHYVPTYQPPTGETRAASPPPSVPQQTSVPSLPPQPSGHSDPTVKREEPLPAQGEKHRSSAASSSSIDSAFSDFSINTEFEASLKETENYHFSQQPFQPSFPRPPPTSSPSTESSLTPSAAPASSPSTESSLTAASVMDEPLSTMRRWVVFRGRTPGIYTSSTEATSQTDAFSNAFMLAFNDPATADHAFERFQEDGTIPNHGHGPWVVFMGRRPGVFTSYNELCASVIGFPNNCYRCCDNLEEGRQALDSFQARQVAATTPAPTTPVSEDDSWWCCIVGAEPGVYQGLDRLIRASPAPGGVRLVDSQADGWKILTACLARGEVRVTARA